MIHIGESAGTVGSVQQKRAKGASIFAKTASMRAGERWTGAVAITGAMLLAAAVARADEPAAAPAAPPAPPAPPAAPPEPERPPRTPLPPIPEPERLPWQRHLELGGGLAFVILPVSSDAQGQRTGVRLDPAAGFNVRLDWEIFRYLHLTGYTVGASHAMELPPGSLGLSRAVDISAPSVFAWTFGVRLTPTLPLTPRIRIWATGGAGWGRVEYGRIHVTEAVGAPFTIRERSASIVEFPLGLGAAFEVVPKWLTVHVEATGAFVPGQVGDAMEPGQAVDGQGHLRTIGSMPRLDASIAQTIGLSLIL